MTYAERCEQELSTLRPRTLKIELTDDEVKDIFEKAGRAGISPEELIARFVSDLTCGCRSGGSDERDYVSSWYDRSGFDEGGSDTFLEFILYWNYYGYVIDLIDDINDCTGQLEMLEKDSEGYDEDFDYFTKRRADSQTELDSVFEEYCEANKEHSELSEELKKVKEYSEKLNTVLNENADT